MSPSESHMGKRPQYRSMATVQSTGWDSCGQVGPARGQNGPNDFSQGADTPSRRMLGHGLGQAVTRLARKQREKRPGPR